MTSIPFDTARSIACMMISSSALGPQSKTRYISAVALVSPLYCDGYAYQWWLQERPRTVHTLSLAGQPRQWCLWNVRMWEIFVSGTGKYLKLEFNALCFGSGLLTGRIPAIGSYSSSMKSYSNATLQPDLNQPPREGYLWSTAVSMMLILISFPLIPASWTLSTPVMVWGLLRSRSPVIYGRE